MNAPETVKLTGAHSWSFYSATALDQKAICYLQKEIIKSPAAANLSWSSM